MIKSSKYQKRKAEELKKNDNYIKDSKRLKGQQRIRIAYIMKIIIGVN